MGRNIMMVAVLLANSVKQATKPVISITAAAGGTSARGWTWPPIHLASPDSCQTPQDGGQGAKVGLQHNQTRAKTSKAGVGGGDWGGGQEVESGISSSGSVHEQEGARLPNPGLGYV